MAADIDDALPPVVDNADAQQLELTVDGATAFLTYHRSPRRFVLLHTEVPDALGGRGIGGALVRAAVDIAEPAGLVVVPKCPFANSWLHEHPDVAERVTVDWRD